MRYDRALNCLVDVVFWVSVESMCWLSLNGDRKGCEGPWMFWPVLTLISGRRRVSWEDNKELQSCRAVPYMIITFVSALAQNTGSQLLVKCWILGPQCPEKILVRSLGCMYVGLGFLGLLAVGKTSMMGRWEFFACRDIWRLVGFLGHFALWECFVVVWIVCLGLFGVWLAVLLSMLLHRRHGVPGMYDFVEGNWGAKLGLLTSVFAWLKVESVVRKRQYELRAQFMRLCGRQSMMSDAHRAGANLLQNQIKSFFFLNITQKSWTHSVNMTQRIEHSFEYDSKNLTLC